MMYSYPFFSFPYFKRYIPNSTMYYNKSALANSKIKKYPPEFSRGYNTSAKPKSSEKPNTSSYSFNFLNNLFNQTDRSKDESYFNLFGLKLYNDDLLLISLIFFLYKEDVKDQYLFVAFILLLLS